MPTLLNLIRFSSLICLVVFFALRAWSGKGFGSAAVAFCLACGLIIIACTISLKALQSRYSGLVVNAWILMLTLCFSIIVGDFVAGYFLLAKTENILVNDPILHHRLPENIDRNVKTEEFSYRIKSNSFGIRAPEPTTKAKGTYRVLMLGDSFTMGVGVSEQETFSGLLEARYKGKNSKFEKVEFINAGVNSYAPILSNILLKRLVAYQPDLVLLNLDMSDVQQENVYRRIAASAQNCPSQVNDPFFLADSKIRLLINDNFYFLRWAGYYFYKIFIQDKQLKDLENLQNKPKKLYKSLHLANALTLDHTLKNPKFSWDDDWLDLFKSVKCIEAFSNSIGADFKLATYPWAHQVSSKYWVNGRSVFELDAEVEVSDRSLDLIKKLAKINSIELVDVFHEFRNYTGSEPLYFDNDLHWTKVGHTLYANVLAEKFFDHILFAKNSDESEPKSSSTN